MKDWKALLGFRLTVDEPRRKVAIFTTPSHMLALEKWRTVGRGRSRIIVDPDGHPWSFSADMVHHKDRFMITVKLKW